jgi:hypothetical protein
MALTGNKTRDGLRHQAERLAITQTAVATTVAAATEQVRRRPLLRAVPSGAATSKGPAHAAFSDPDQQAAREAAADAYNTNKVSRAIFGGLRLYS